MAICSTDTFSLTPDGRYRWSADRLAQNHEANLRRATAFLDEGRSVIVDNTNIQAWQPRAYVRHAVKLGVQVRFVRATVSKRASGCIIYVGQDLARSIVILLSTRPTSTAPNTHRATTPTYTMCLGSAWRPCGATSRS